MIVSQPVFILLELSQSDNTIAKSKKHVLPRERFSSLLQRLPFSQKSRHGRGQTGTFRPMKTVNQQGPGCIAQNFGQALGLIAAHPVAA